MGAPTFIENLGYTHNSLEMGNPSDTPGIWLSSLDLLFSSHKEVGYRSDERDKRDSQEPDQFVVTCEITPQDVNERDDP